MVNTTQHTSQPAAVDQSVKDRALLSALMDGALDEEDCSCVMAQLAKDETLINTWDTYHMIGQAMRSNSAPLQAADAAFVLRLRQQLSQEPPWPVAIDAVASTTSGAPDFQVPAANDGWWRQVVGCAGVALLALLVWQGSLLLNPGAADDAHLAQSTQTNAQVLAADQGAPLLRDAQLDALLAAHRQAGGAAALQMSAGFLRNATFNEAQP